MKNNKWLITGGVILLSLTLIGVSFAFFSPIIKGNDTVGENSVTSGTLELTFKEDETNEINMEDARPGKSAFKTFTVENTGTLEDMYTYNIKLTELKTTYKEKDLKYTLQEFNDESYETPKENGLNVNGFINEKTVKDKEMYLAVKINRPENTQKHYYKLTITFEELKDVNQNYNQGAEFSGKINVDTNAKAMLYDELQEHQFYATMMSNPEEVLKDDFGNLRYVGATPHNYIWFNCEDYTQVTDENTAKTQNCEKWRIIGLFKDIEKVNDDGTNTEQSLVKIIRADSIGDIAWDTYLVNDWTNATLKETLNNETTGYISSSYSDSDGIKGITANTKGMIEKVKWNIGKVENNVFTSTITSQVLYNAERGSETYKEQPYVWPGYIGLMYISDYGYAAGGNCLDVELTNYSVSCIDSDWLANGANQWTLTPVSATSSWVFLANDTGSFSLFNTDEANGVRPSLYISSKVGIKEGVGTGDDTHPYILEVVE